MIRTKHLVPAIAAAALAISAIPAEAKTMKMTVVAAAPPIVTFVHVAKTKFIPEVNRRLAASGKDFKIEWTQAYSQSLAKFSEVFETVEEGVAQVGLILKNFEPSKLALEQYNYVTPFVGHNAAQMVTIDRNLRKRVPELNKLYEKYDQVFLHSGVSDSMQLFTKFPVKKFEDLKGHKIGASGSMGLWLKNTGAVRVNSSMLNSFTDIKNGLYDGYPISELLAFPYKTYEVAKYLTRTKFGVSATSAITVNTDTWNDMPAHAREIFRDVAQDYGKWQIEVDTGKFSKFVGIMKKKGVKIYEMPEEERQRWANQLPNLAKEWADRLEKLGMPGHKVVQAFMDEARALNVPIARNWDRE
jgi:TRAP-type C4-dicarboxylate transport system substrate-binding protein